ncbi:transglutaminase family protein [Kineococcus sp. SYSU DK003]|uniref:transglutaminase family protein n=1 Tax=Kineococcus sp. SYSU DK003 TaxID=3383124 RepID=UPI003D7EDF9C
MSLQLRRPVTSDDLPATHAPGTAAVVWAAVAVVAGVLGLVVTGGVPAPAAVTTAVAVAVGALVRSRAVPGQLAGLGGALSVVVWLPAVVSGQGVLAVWPVVAAALAVRQVATVRTVRELRVVLALAVLMTLAAAGIAPSNALVGPLALAWVAVLAGSACSVPHRPVDAAVRRRAGAALLAAGTAGVLAFLLVPAPSGAAFGSGAWARAAAQATGAANGSVGRSAAAYAGGTLDLSARGALPQTELLQVPVQSPALWRAAVLDVYDGRTWTSSAPVTSWTSRTGPDGSAQWVADAEDGASQVQRTDEVRPLGDYPALVAAGSPVGARTAARLVGTGSGTFLAPADAPYAVTSREVPTVEDPTAGGGAAQSPADPERWLQLPASVPARVHALAAQLTASAAGDPVVAAQAVSRHLRSVARYSLDAPVPGRGVDAVDAFLFTDRIGFCEQFASAQVVLLRSAGFPARLATGFAGGEPSGGQRVLRSADAHAWVEVWVPGQGWTSSDPTAGAQLVAGSGSAWWQRVWSWLQLQVAALLADPAARTAAAGVLAVVLAVGAVLVRRARVRGGVRAGVRGGVVQVLPGRGGDPSVRALLVALERFDAAVPPAWRRGPSEGLSDWRGRLLSAGAPGTSVQARQRLEVALRVTERACFARAVPSRQELQEARGALESASSTLLAAGRSPSGGSSASAAFVGG